jgi:hypothetical protein
MRLFEQVVSAFSKVRTISGSSSSEALRDSFMSVYQDYGLSLIDFKHTLLKSKLASLPVTD